MNNFANSEDVCCDNIDKIIIKQYYITELIDVLTSQDSKLRCN